MECVISMHKGISVFLTGVVCQSHWCRWTNSRPQMRIAVPLSIKGLVQAALSSQGRRSDWKFLVEPENTGHRRLSPFDRVSRMIRYKKSNFSKFAWSSNTFIYPSTRASIIKILYRISWYSGNFAFGCWRVMVLLATLQYSSPATVE